MHVHGMVIYYMYATPVLFRPVGSIFEVQRPLKNFLLAPVMHYMYSMFDIDDDNSIVNVNTLI